MAGAYADVPNGGNSSGYHDVTGLADTLTREGSRGGGDSTGDGAYSDDWVGVDAEDDTAYMAGALHGPLLPQPALGVTYTGGLVCFVVCMLRLVFSIGCSRRACGAQVTVALC